MVDLSHDGHNVPYPTRHPGRRVGQPAMARIAARPAQAASRPYRRTLPVAGDGAPTAAASQPAAVAPEPLLVTSREYRLAVAKQLAEVGIEHPRLVLEPCGRNTAPALTLACLALG